MQNMRIHFPAHFSLPPCYPHYQFLSSIFPLLTNVVLFLCFFPRLFYPSNANVCLRFLSSYSRLISSFRRNAGWPVDSESYTHLKAREEMCVFLRFLDCAFLTFFYISVSESTVTPYGLVPLIVLLLNETLVYSLLIPFCSLSLSTSFSGFPANMMPYLVASTSLSIWLNKLLQSDSRKQPAGLSPRISLRKTLSDFQFRSITLGLRTLRQLFLPG